MLQVLPPVKMKSRYKGTVDTGAAAKMVCYGTLRPTGKTKIYIKAATRGPVSILKTQ